MREPACFELEVHGFCDPARRYVGEVEDDVCDDGGAEESGAGSDKEDRVDVRSLGGLRGRCGFGGVEGAEDAVLSPFHSAIGSHMDRDVGTYLERDQDADLCLFL